MGGGGQRAVDRCGAVDPRQGSVGAADLGHRRSARPNTGKPDTVTVLDFVGRIDFRNRDFKTWMLCPDCSGQ